jgi:hypothetical protein
MLGCAWRPRFLALTIESSGLCVAGFVVIEWLSNRGIWEDLDEAQK